MKISGFFEGLIPYLMVFLGGIQMGYAYGMDLGHSFSLGAGVAFIVLFGAQIFAGAMRAKMVHINITATKKDGESNEN